jgi:hypothetical protein
MARKVLRELLLFAIFLAMAVALTWPLAIRLSTTVSDKGDPLLNAWIINWDQYAWTHGRAVYQAPIFYPAKYPLAFSENLFGIAALMMPFYLAGLGSLTVHNLAFLIGLALCGYGASVLARVVSQSMTAGIVCGALFAFCQFRFDHLPHLQIIWSGWLPLILAALLVYWRDGRLRTAVLFGAALLMNGLTNIHWLLFGTTTAGITVLVLALVAWRRSLRFWIQLGVVTAIALALLVPVLLPYKTVSELYGMHRGVEEVQQASATWMDWLWASSRNDTWGRLPDWSKTKPERLLFPGMLPLLLTGAALLLYRRRDADPSITIAPPGRGSVKFLPILDGAIVISLLLAYVGGTAVEYNLGLVRINSADLPILALLVLVAVRFSFAFPRAWRGARSLRVAAQESRFPLEFWLALLWIVVGFVGSLGLNAFFHTALYYRVQAFQSLRVPARWAMIAYVGFIATGSLGVAALVRDRRGISRALVIAGLAIAAFFDVRTRIVWDHDVAVEPVYRWLASAKPAGPVLELPMNDDMFEYAYTGREAIHHAELFNGASGFYPPIYLQLESWTEKKSIPGDLVTMLESNGCRFLIVHDDWLRDTAGPTHEWLGRELAARRLGFLRRFDDGIGGDWLFAVTRNVPDWPTLHDPDRDPVGRTADDELQAMLAGLPTYSSSPVAHLDTPQHSRDVHLPFPVTGWALAPDGIKSVDILFESGRVRIPAELVERGDVKALYPWFPRVPRPGFQKIFDRRPHGVRVDTDMSVEVTDSRGRKLRLPDVVVHFK